MNDLTICEYITKVKDNKKKVKYIKNKIKSIISQGNIDRAKSMITEYEKEDCFFDIDIACAKIILMVIENKLKEAKDIAIGFLQKHPFNFNLLFNLAYIYELNGEYQEAVNTYIKAITVSETDEEMDELSQSIARIDSMNLGIDISDLYKADYRMFPLCTNQVDNKETYLGQVLFKDQNGQGYIPQYYSEATMEYSVDMWEYYKTETLHGKEFLYGEYEFKIINDSILPISFSNRINISLNDKEYEFSNIASNRYNYFNIKGDTNVKIKSDNKFIVGTPIEVHQNKKNEVKLVLCLFIDGLAQEIFDETDIKEIMPNTYRFFSKGSIFKNCYSNSEWTLPSMATIHSGKYQINHGIFHPELPHEVGVGYPIMSEYFKAAEYLTFQACGDWRKAPTYGYAKGFDRTVYQTISQGMRCENVIHSFLEQMRSFPNRDKFIWLSFAETHHSLNILPDISNQISNSIESHDYTESSEKLVFRGFDKNKKERYINEIKRIDYYINLIYDHIEQNYNNEEILITLISDHGQTFLKEDEHIIGKCRTNIPFMIRGKNIPQGKCEKLMENVDILPTLLNYSGIDFDENVMDGKIIDLNSNKEDKKFVYSESIYPDRTYKACIRDSLFEFKFETKGNVTNDGRIPIDDFEFDLYDRKTNKVVTNDYDNLVVKYIDIVMKHIKDKLKI